MTTPLAAKNIKLRRQLRQERVERVEVLAATLDRAAYDQWVFEVNQKIKAINQRIRESA